MWSAIRFHISRVMYQFDLKKDDTTIVLICVCVSSTAPFDKYVVKNENESSEELKGGERERKWKGKKMKRNSSQAIRRRVKKTRLGENGEK